MLQQAPWRTREEKPTSMMAAKASPAPLEAGKMVNGMRIIESDEDAQATHPSKLDKEPLLESIYQEVTGGAPVKFLSPHRVMQASKAALLCCLYMGIGRSLLESWVDRESLHSVLSCGLSWIVCMCVSNGRLSRQFLHATSTCPSFLALSNYPILSTNPSSLPPPPPSLPQSNHSKQARPSSSSTSTSSRTWTAARASTTQCSSPP